MPQQDGTGPNGQGARTGRGMGNCNGQGRELGHRQGRGMGRRSGLGRGVNSQSNSWLQTQLADLQAAIEKLAEKIK